MCLPRESSYYEVMKVTVKTDICPSLGTQWFEQFTMCLMSKLVRPKACPQLLGSIDQHVVTWTIHVSVVDTKFLIRDSD